ncbi:MAG: Alcohol dehydrogenase GroES domain protein [Myxococcaceae bacterium]|nr:Alcohol dehydrogenase GroES domain protein [Myxococcaceae bacterium]
MTASLAAALVAAKEPLKLISRTLPAPSAGEVTLKLEACALGLSDWDVAMLDGLPRLPVVLGAEAVGRVTACGPGVALAVGQRVALTPLASTCGACALCERGLEQYCAKIQVHGFGRDGALTTAGNFLAQHLLPIDDGLDAAALCAVLTSAWSALGGMQAAAIGNGQTIAVFGVGGVGAQVIQVARMRGARVIAVEPEADRRALALQLGAERALAPADAPSLKHSVHAALVCTPSTQAIVQAQRALLPAGNLVLLGGGPATRFDLPLFDVVARGISIRGSFLGSRSELLEVLEWVRAGKLQAPFVRAPLADAPERLYGLRDLGFLGRLIFDL